MPETRIHDWIRLGAALRDARRRERLSQHELARRAGVSWSWLAKVEAGHRSAEFEQVLRVLDALDLTLVLRNAEPAGSPREAPDRGRTSGAAMSEARHIGGLAQAARQSGAASRRNSWAAAEQSGTGPKPRSGDGRAGAPDG